VVAACVGAVVGTEVSGGGAVVGVGVTSVLVAGAVVAVLSCKQQLQWWQQTDAGSATYDHFARKALLSAATLLHARYALVSTAFSSTRHHEAQNERTKQRTR
jgi:hypothetical protein